MIAKLFIKTLWPVRSHGHLTFSYRKGLLGTLPFLKIWRTLLRGKRGSCFMGKQPSVSVSAGLFISLRLIFTYLPKLARVFKLIRGMPRLSLEGELLVKISWDVGELGTHHSKQAVHH